MTTLTTYEPVCRFDAQQHEYTCDGIRVPSITGLIKAAGLVRDDYYTEDSRIRGQAVHQLAADYDLGAISDPRQVEPTDWRDRFKGFFLGYVKAMETLRPEWLAIEQARFCLTRPRWAGRPDRECKLFKAVSVLEIKAAQKQPWHGVQLALQSILVAPLYHLKPEMIRRYILYLRENGRYELVECPRRQDFDEARRLVRDYARSA